MEAKFLDHNNRELKWNLFRGDGNFNRTWRHGLCNIAAACSCSPHCRRAPLGDVKLVCLALWRQREYLNFISIRLVAFSNQNLQIILLKWSLFSLSHISSSISKLCYLNFYTSLNVSMFSCHRVKIQLGKQPTVSELDMGQNFPTSQIKVSRQKIWTPIFQLCVFSSLFSLEYRINETHWKLYRIVGNTMY